jgi:hypothetical protein
MLIYIYLAVIITALYGVAKVLLPEMAKPPLPRATPRTTPKPISSVPYQPKESENRIEKLEKLLAEKNKNIQILQTELKSFYEQVRYSDKVKTLLEEEVHRLREQNRIFRSELGLPAAQQKENSIV